jgi:hypothetical protein
MRTSLLFTDLRDRDTLGPCPLYFLAPEVEYLSERVSPLEYKITPTRISIARQGFSQDLLADQPVLRAFQFSTLVYHDFGTSSHREQQCCAPDFGN